ncbi:hypothetical protein OSB04_031493 [Centaurea solstitialis]|uniref:Uncharacterized protein n=1 Tax=Centaurea solstitialis TaxID=347529 RepID=A0AA38W4S9_9ASTR|nr:hypothetical protein OSB04_031493 [Centaurea solstitialis]
MEACKRLQDIFQDNKNSRAVTLEQELSHTNMEDYPNASAYCQRLKVLSDQLKNVAYNDVGTLLRQTNPLPSFYQARSMLILEEAGLAKQAANGATSAMAAMYQDNQQPLYSPDASNSSRSYKGARRGGHEGSHDGVHGNNKSNRGGYRGGRSG